jgi:hypothetical protein
MLFYKVIEGGLEKPDKMVIECKDLHLKDIGDSGSTDWVNDESAVEIYMKKPELMQCRSGLIHSHNRMDCFFSPTDMEELEDNSVGIDYYLSLIVNNSAYHNWIAKLAIQGKEEVTTVYKFVGKLKDLFNKEEEKESPALFSYDMDIEVIAEGVLGEIAENTQEVAAMIAARTPKNSFHTSRPGVTYPNRTGFGYQNEYYLDEDEEEWRFGNPEDAAKFFGSATARPTFNGKTPVDTIDLELDRFHASIFMGMPGVLNLLKDSVRKMVGHLKSPVEYNKFAAQKLARVEGIIEKKYGAPLTPNFVNEVIVDFMNALNALKGTYHGNSKEHQLCEAVLSAFSADLSKQLELDIPE